MSRTSKSVKNIGIALIGQIAIILIGFVARKLFILFLSAEYLGLNGLFSSVLTVLSLMELGIGPAMVFSLYKPIAMNDISTCRALMSVYKKTYRVIGSAVLIVGICITPFITHLIKEVPEEISQIHIIYLLFVVNVSISYFFAYKRSFITASQNQYLIEGIHAVVYLMMNIVQIAILALTRNYILYLVVQIFSTFLENLVLSRMADNRYPWLREKTKGELPDEKKQEIVRNVKAMVFHRVGGIVSDTIDNLLISKFFGLQFLGLYSNYLLVINALNSLTQKVFSAIVAGIGDFGAQKSPEDSYQLYKKIQFFNFWLITFCSVSLWILVNPFISLIWLGSDYLISLPILAAIILNFYISGMRKTILTFKEALGLPWYDRFKPLFGAAVNLIASVVLADWFGVIGIFIGTILMQFSVNVWFESMVLFKYGFCKKWSFFLKEYVLQTCVFLLITFVTSVINMLLPTGSISMFIVRCLLCLLIPNGIIILLFHNTDEFTYLISLSQKIFRAKK